MSNVVLPNPIIATKAIINKLSTNTDGGYRIVLDISEDDTEKIKDLIDMKHQSCLIAVAFQKVDD